MNHGMTNDVQNRKQFLIKLSEICDKNVRFKNHITMVTNMCINKKIRAEDYLNDLYEYWRAGKRIEDKLWFQMQVMGYNHCKNICNEYECVNKYKNRCFYSNKKCNVQLHKNHVQCVQAYGNNPCRKYYWCALEKKCS